MMLTLGAFMFLSTILLNFYTTMNATGEEISSGQDGILSTTISASYLEMAQGLAFDVVTDSSDIALYNVNVLTSATLLGRESAGEDSIHEFDDFDDFNNFTVEKDAGTTGRRYRTTFKVSYVNPSDVATITTSKTFLKRLDLKTWRVKPPMVRSSRLDTLKMSMAMGYFHFD